MDCSGSQSNLVADRFRLDDFKLPFGGPFLHFEPWLSHILTVVWIISITNAVNLIDGLDGLVRGCPSSPLSDDGDCFYFFAPAQSLLTPTIFVLVLSVRAFSLQLPPGYHLSRDRGSSSALWLPSCPCKG